MVLESDAISRGVCQPPQSGSLYCTIPYLSLDSQCLFNNLLIVKVLTMMEVDADVMKSHP